MGQTIATNKKGFRDYFFSDKWECGIALKGSEVKSIRSGEVNFKDSYARIENGEVYLYSLHVTPYQQASHLQEDPDRVRKLLLNKREIRKMTIAVTQKNFTLIPTKIYFNNRGFVKVEVALARGKKMYDKRATVKKRIIDRELGRAMRRKR